MSLELNATIKLNVDYFLMDRCSYVPTVATYINIKHSSYYIATALYFSYLAMELRIDFMFSRSLSIRMYK